MAARIRSVFIGNFAKTKSRKIYSLKNYARFYNELAESAPFEKISVFGGYVTPGETGFDFSYEECLDDQIRVVLSKGNTPDTPLFSFIWNNFKLFVRLTFFSLRKDHYFIFLPSPMGVFSVLIVSLFRRKKSLGIYIGGHYGAEQSFEKRNGTIKKKIKKLGACWVDRLVDYSIRKSDYTITSSYRYHYLFSSNKKTFLTPPLINVLEEDLSSSFEKGDQKIITYCGELRHAKGVIDLLNAFTFLIKEKKLSNCKLKIIGSGQAYDEMVQIANSNSISEKVIFCGQIKDRDLLKREIGMSSVFVLPSYSEGFPRVAYEAFTLGVPTVLTPVGGIPFLVEDNVHSLLVQPGAVYDLAEAIANLLKDEKLSRRLVINARKLMKESIFPRIRHHHSLSYMVSQKINEIA